MNLPSVTILILNWNNAADTLACLGSVFRLDYPNYRVLVVDNGSTDDSVEQIRRAYPQVEVIENGENLGFAEGNNVGIRRALENGADFIGLVNDDARVKEDALTRLVEVAQLNPAAGFLGPAIFTETNPPFLLSAGGQIGADGVVRLLSQVDGAQRVDFLSGAALLARRSAIEQIGLLDGGFFLYHEDVDWCYRCRQAGFELWMVPQAVAFHPDTRTRDENSTRVTYYMTRNHLAFLRKHHFSLTVQILVILGYLRTWLSWSLRPKWRSKRAQRGALAAGLWDGLFGRMGRKDI